MRSNMSFVDKIIRMLVAIVISIIVFTKLIVGPVAIGFFIFAYILVLTCFRGRCPFYRLFGINTNRNLNDKARMYEYKRNQTLLKNYLRNYQERYPDMGNIDKQYTRSRA
ncbi:YgaP family membrane protein [Sediminibacterium soli]|uniref:YgaP family membrane protein n=1 Tax=Sediminibacterium soli TaxID=2698829 RepID=UPI00137A8EF1|nr:DUF2892 domain-containing protein [Sediminibacterium soli]NCI47391.1 DUF2892 domain-containing protein [Sediminibacterium soli]